MSHTDTPATEPAAQAPAPGRRPVAAFAVEREALIGSFAAASELLDAAAAGTAQVDPGLVDLTERLAVRILVKHHGWRMTAPGQLVRIRS